MGSGDAERRMAGGPSTTTSAPLAPDRSDPARSPVGESATRRASLLTWGVPVAGVAAAAIGVFYFSSWLLGAAAHWSVIGVLTMKTNMSLALVMAGSALLLLDPRRTTRRRRAAGTVLAVAVSLVGALTMFEHLFQVSLGIDQLLAREPPGAVATAQPNRMGPPGAVSLTLLGAGLLALGLRRRIACYFGLAVSVVALVPAVGFVTGAVQFYGERVSGIAWPTVVAVLLLSAGMLLAEAPEGLLALLWRDDPGGRLLRRLLPAAVAAPLVVELLMRLGGRYGLYEHSTGVGILLIGLIVVMSGLLWRSASRLSGEAAHAREMEDELRESSRRKDEFLGLLSHELRNPLAPITNSLYILEHADPTGQQARRAKEVIGRQVGHLAHLVDDLLEVTRISRGKIQLRCSRLDLAELVRRSGEDHRDLFRNRGLVYSMDLPDRRVWVNGDETRLAQVVGNLLQNAAKFTPTGGRVVLSVVARDDVAEVRVRDTGTGIDPRLIDHVFDPFVQAEQSLARTEGGLGLGLALVKGLAELHGGSVEARSAGVGQGAEFVVRLGTVAGAADDPGDSPPRRHVNRVLRVLVVDDNVDAAESLAELVRMFGHEVEVAHDGPAAVAKAKAAAPDLILCDIGLPGMTGYDVAREVRSDPSTRSTRLVAVTGYAQPEDVERAAAAGFVGHVSKPPEPATLERYLSMT